MIGRRVLVALAVLLVTACSAADNGSRTTVGTGAAAETHRTRGATMRGVALAEIHPGRGLGPYRHALDDLKELGAEWVLLPVHGYVDSAGAPTVSDEWEPPVDLAAYRRFVGAIARAAHERGLQTLLVPYLNLRKGEPTDWRGNLHPADWPAWFASYERFLDGWVELARTEQISMLAVGAELGSSESEADAWRGLIARVRTRYPGEVTYSCNWDHYRETPFLESLDRVGISGYYSLAWDTPLTDDSLRQLWLDVRTTLIDWQQEIDRPLFFTEIGYPSINGGARDPWNYLMTGSPNPGEQARGLAAFCDAWRGRPELSGVFFWNWSPFRGGERDPSYSIRGKPASGLVREWFRDGRR